MSRRWSRGIEIVFLAVVSYVPALTAAPGRMPADSKLYLYLDPARLIADARWTFDPAQFGGWVPHQHITFVWPSGPWFWVWDRVGIPDWVAHRLWIGTLLFAAATGVAWCARALGLRRSGALVAAVIYVLSPYLLAYVSRTSVMLLPWAGLGWIVGLTVRATTVGGTAAGGWRYPAAIALIVATVGSVNVTALLMIVPGPLLWLVHAGAARIVSWRRVVHVASRTALGCVAVSSWWITMSVVQRRHGAPVLDFSEALDDVAHTATGPEVLRGLGYWLFYVRDSFAATTTASLPHLISTRVIVVSFVLVIAAAVAAVRLRWRHRRLAVAWLAVGFLLGVGTHPVDHPTPAGRMVASLDGLALALRSSTRAAPVMLLGLALLIGAYGTATRSPLRVFGAVVDRGAVAVVAATVLALANLPAWWSGGFVDPAIDRDQDPPSAWVMGAAALDARDADARVLQLPGAEFGSFRWGHTVDQPLVALTERPVLTRDLLPLGSAGIMDLLFALDDRVQDGLLEPASVAPVARLAGVDTIWITNDLAHERYRTARPEALADLLETDPSLHVVGQFGDPSVNRSDPPRIDERSLADPRLGAAVAPVVLVDVDEPGSIVRVADRVVAVSGSGEGIVDAAAAGLITGHELVVLTAQAPDVVERADVDRFVITDSFRDRPRHWRGSQDTHGPTASSDPDLAPLVEPLGVRDLDLAPDAPDSARTRAEQVGAVRATATLSGERFAFLPEVRPVFALDGDRSTAWTVGPHVDPVGERLRILTDVAIEELSLVQHTGSDRRITRIRIERPDGADQAVALDPRSSVEGQRVVIPAVPGGGYLDLVVTGVTDGSDPVGLAEVVDFDRLGVAPTVEVVTTPTDAVGLIDADTPRAIVLTRWRSDPMNRWRSDPEPVLRRAVVVDPDGALRSRDMDLDVTIRIDPRASEDRLADLVGAAAIASARLVGVPGARGHAAVDGRDDTAWITPFGGATGASLSLIGLEAPTDRVRIVQPAGEFARITSFDVIDATGVQTVDVVAPATPGRHGSVLELDRPIGPGPVSFVIASTDAATTIDRRFGDLVELPAAIATLDPGVALTWRDPVAGTDRCRDDLLTLDGVAVPIRVAVDPDALGAIDGPPLRAEPCVDEPVEVVGRLEVTATSAAATGLQVDRVVLVEHRDAGSTGPAAIDAAPSVRVTDRHRLGATAEVAGCREGCWFVFGEGHGDPWRATVHRADGSTAALGAAVPVNGGANGWWIGPEQVHDAAVTVEVNWTAQGPLDLAWLLTAFGILGALVAIAVDRRRAGAVASRWHPELRSRGTGGGPGVRRSRGIAITWVIATVVLAGPVVAIAVVPFAIAVALTPSYRTAEWAGVAGLVVMAASVVVINRIDRPLPDYDWPLAFSGVHALSVVSVLALLAGALWDRDRPPTSA